MVRAMPGAPPPLSRPVDFQEFWSRTLEALEGVPADVRREPAGAEPSGCCLEWLSFCSLGGVRVHGYLIRWEDGGERPLVVHSHGYGDRCEPQWSWARAGLNVLGVDIRGWGRSRDALPGPSPWGWILTGIESPEQHALRGAVCDYRRAVEVAGGLLAGRVSRIVLHGVSFSGGLALMAEALTHAADLLVVGVPTFGWAEGRRLYVQAGSGAEINRFLARRPEHAAEDLMVVLRYFDPANFADLVRCPTLVGVGMTDEVVPAPTVLAIAARLGGPYEIMRFPVSHSSAPEERRWLEFERRWLKLALTGTPKGFGRPAAGRRPNVR